MTWSGGCYDPPGATAKAGYFSLAAGDVGMVRIIGDPRFEGLDPTIGYTECFPTQTFEIPMENVGFADLAMGTAPICGPQSTPIEAVSWGRLKRSFE